MLSGNNLIGRRDSSQGNAAFHAVNPVTAEELEPVYREATAKEVDEAVQLAAQAFAVYRKSSARDRAAFMDAIAIELESLGDALPERAHLETALPLARLQGERGRTVGQLRLFANLLREGSWVQARIDTGDPERQPVPKPDIRQWQIPLGPVGIFGASNFPLAFSVAGGDTASALAAGCPVVVKAHPAHPGTSELVGKAIRSAAQKTGMPEGVFSLLHGPSPDVGMAIVRHPLIKAIGFTGSFRGGKAIFDAAVRREEPIPVYAEMGSSNPVFLLPGALAERGEAIAKGLVSSVNLGVGQFCTNPGLVIGLQDEAMTRFRQLAAADFSATPGGTMLTAGIRQGYERGLARLGEVEYVEILAQGTAAESAAGVSPYLLQTSAGALLQNPALAEEVFGPSSLLVLADTEEELYETARGLSGHLTATIHGTVADLSRYRELVDILTQKVGRLIINGYPTGVEVCHAMMHGGPYPATTDSRSTSVGTAAIYRFTRPVCYQDFPQTLLPEALRDGNPLGIWRMVNGAWVME